MKINQNNARPSLSLNELMNGINIHQAEIKTSFELSTLEQIGAEDSEIRYSASIDRILEKAGVSIIASCKVELRSDEQENAPITCDYLDLSKDDISINIQGAKLSLNGEEVDSIDFCADDDVIEAFYQSVITSLDMQTVNSLINAVIPYNTKMAA
ncbi:hypothetical protein [Acinetobacter sp. P1(2025)]|uniref:hypothetical protein n=1 Tax=Acinetobacter sp. P1(2025) TaxID=3446120 RepID=UPI003F52C210